MCVADWQSLQECEAQVARFGNRNEIFAGVWGWSVVTPPTRTKTSTSTINSGRDSSTGEAIAYIPSTRRSLIAGGLRIDYAVKVPAGTYVLSCRQTSTQGEALAPHVARERFDPVAQGGDELGGVQPGEHAAQRVVRGDAVL